MKADMKKKHSFKIWYCRRALWIPCATRKMNKEVLGQIKPETSLEAKIAELKLSILRKHGALEKTIMLGNGRQQQKKKDK